MRGIAQCTSKRIASFISTGTSTSRRKISITDAHTPWYWGNEPSQVPATNSFSFGKSGRAGKVPRYGRDFAEAPKRVGR